MACDHDLVAREMAVEWDGLCPLCLKAEIERLRAVADMHLERVNVTRENYGADCDRLRALLREVADAITDHLPEHIDNRHWQVDLLERIMPAIDVALRGGRDE